MTRILIVDDKEANLYYLQALLNGQGYQVATARHGAEALAMARLAPPGMIVSDLLMPVMDGYTLLRLWKADESLRDIPFVVYTATYTKPDDERLALDMGADAFILKPAEPDAFLARLSTVKEVLSAPAAVPRQPGHEEKDLLAVYSKTLIRKLEEKTQELEATNRALKQDINEREQARLERLQLTRELGERVKELRALYDISSLLRDDLRPLNELLAEMVRILPGAMQYPELAGARVRVGELENTSPQFQSTPWLLEADFVTSDGRSGLVQIAYCEEPREEGDLFLVEEHRLIESLAGMLRAHLERRISQEALWASEARLRAIVESEPQGLNLVSLDGILLDTNPAGLRMMEAAALNEITGKSAVEFAHPEDRSALLDLHQQAARGGIGQLDLRLISLRGTERWIEARLAPLRAAAGGISAVLHVMSDIAERKAAEAAISHTTTLLRAVAEGTTDAVFVKDLEGRYLFINEATARFIGLPASEILGHDDSEVFSPEDAAVIKASDTRVTTSGEPHTTEEVLTSAGATRTYLATKAPYRDHRGEIIGLIGISRDITEKKKLESHVLRAQRMESIGTLAGGIAHDLNNVLAPIMMSIDLLKASETDPRRLGILSTIEGSAKRGADMVRQVLSFARGVQGQRQGLHLGRLLAEMAKIARDTFPKNIDVQQRDAADLWTVAGDPTQIHQVLLNLCVNARDAMPHGGVLTLAARNVQVDEPFAAMSVDAQPGPHVLVEVEDTGVGMKPEVLDRVFEPFFTTKETGSGTGLGLASSLAIVKSHGGFIQAQSEPGSGAQFQVYLPAAAGDETGMDAGNTTATAEVGGGKGEWILLVEDEAAVRQITRQTLEASGYQVLTASDGAEAASIYAAKMRDIAVVLTDMMMPIMDGPATIQVLQRLNPEVRIIAASGLNLGGMAAKASSLGVRHFIPKPYTARTLLAHLREVIDGITQS